jgi:hypothetical protein
MEEAEEEKGKGTDRQGKEVNLPETPLSCSLRGCSMLC